MKKLPKEKLLVYGGVIVCMIVATPLLHRIKRTRGRNFLWHLLYVVGATAACLLLPDSIADEMFSPGGVLLIGTLYPVYESIHAICTIGEADDTAWLQFWIASASLSFSTEWIDNIKEVLPNAGEHWYKFEFLVNLWMILPMTDGATLIYDKFTKRFIAPTAQKVSKWCEGYIALMMGAVNTSYIWMVWFAFVSMPEEARRFLVVALGTIYPIAASTVAITTENTGLDDTLWLTYWATFSLLFVLMDYLENFVGHIRGFYSLIVLATVYLFLPMFNGAEVVFRRVLVPLSGHYENMLIHDAYLVKAGMEKSIPAKDRERVFLKTADIFSKRKAS